MLYIFCLPLQIHSPFSLPCPERLIFKDRSVGSFCHLAFNWVWPIRGAVGAERARGERLEFSLHMGSITLHRRPQFFQEALSIQCPLWVPVARPCLAPSGLKMVKGSLPFINPKILHYCLTVLLKPWLRVHSPTELISSSFIEFSNHPV